MFTVRFRRLVLPVLLLLFCASGTPARAEDNAIIVSAAASLMTAMTSIKKAYESDHPGQQVYVNFAASGRLLQQIEAGAPVDVFTPADEDTMNRAQKEHLIEPETRVNFTANNLLLVVPANSTTIHTANDLADPKIGKIALGEPDSVPAGSYTKEALSALGLWEKLEPKMIYGLSVKQALDYAALGEVDAAFIYETDALMAKQHVQTVTNMGGHKRIVYPVAVVTGSNKKDKAKDFIAFLTGEQGQTILKEFGFKTPGHGASK